MPFRTAAMNRREFVKSSTAALALGLSGCAGPALRPDVRPERPSIVLCMTDDQGWGDTGYNGHRFLKTPNLDSMAASGIRFDRFYAGAALGSRFLLSGAKDESMKNAAMKMFEQSLKDDPSYSPRWEALSPRIRDLYAEAIRKNPNSRY